MNTRNFAVSSMYVRLLWEKENKDILDLILPFVLQTLRSEYSKGDMIDNLKIVKKLETDYYLSDFPIAVLQTILKRLAKTGVLSRVKGHYIIAKKIKYDAEFDNSLKDIKNKMEIIIREICEELDLSFEDQSQYAEKLILKFLEKYGYLAMVSPNGFVEDDDYDMYRISKFIIKHFESKTEIFSYWLQMIEGFMLMQVVYFSSVSKVDIKAKLDGLDVYLDTVLLLRVLGFKSEEENRMGKTLLSLLKEHKSNILCFEHNFKELEGIVLYYKENIYSRKNPTLEYFDEKQFDADDVEEILYDLENSLNSAGVKLMATPEYTKDNIDYDEAKLQDYLSKNINYTKEINLFDDIKSITAIRRIRVDQHKQNCDKIENSGAIFVTSNWRLSKFANEYFSKTEDHIGKRNFSVAINDTNMTTLIWIKQNSKDKDLPKIRLMENAYASTRPSTSLINTAIEYAKTRKYESGSTKERFRDTMLVALREEETRDELMIHTKGNKEVVPQFIELKYSQMIQAMEDNKALVVEVKKLKIDNEEALRDIKQTEEIMQSSRNYIYITIEKKASKLANILMIIFYIFISLALGFSVYKLLVLLRFFSNENELLFSFLSSVLFLIIGFVISRFDLISKKVDSLQNRLSFKIRRKYIEKEKKKGNPLF